MALMLLGTAAVYFALHEIRGALILLFSLVPVLGIDVFLEARSRSALRKLAQALAPTAEVVRDGALREVASSELVRGDWLLLKEGGILHADGVVRTAANLSCDESSL